MKDKPRKISYATLRLLQLTGKVERLERKLHSILLDIQAAKDKHSSATKYSNGKER